MPCASLAEQLACNSSDQDGQVKFELLGLILWSEHLLPTMPPGTLPFRSTAQSRALCLQKAPGRSQLRKSLANAACPTAQKVSDRQQVELAVATLPTPKLHRQAARRSGVMWLCKPLLALISCKIHDTKLITVVCTSRSFRSVRVCAAAAGALPPAGKCLKAQSWCLISASTFKCPRGLQLMSGAWS